MLGRSKRLEDIYIIPRPNLDVSLIKCDPDALAETKRLEKIFFDTKKEDYQKKENHWKISYLNVRSLKSLDGHREDVLANDLLMKSDLMGLGETWLQDGDIVNFDQFTGHFATFGTGKGVAGYSKLTLVDTPKVVATETCSAIFFKTQYFHVIFMYLSKDHSKNSVHSLLDEWIHNDMPTAILGDVNENIFKHSAIEKYLASKGFQQLIHDPTCSTGSTLDHIYVNQPLIQKKIFSQLEAVYFSDHDVITLYVSKNE